MTLTEIRNKYRARLEKFYPIEEIDSIFHLLLKHLTGKCRLDMAMNPEIEPDAVQALQFEEALDKLVKEFPVQYLIGSTEFCGRNFMVSPDVLIPRPETEQLVHWIVSDCGQYENLKIMDIGTGSGCIVISLACSLKGSICQAVDISVKALELARQNASINEAKVQFTLMDILEIEEFTEQYDLIVSNPPYVRESEKSAMRGNVLKHEPEIALYVKDEDPLLFYRSIAKLALRSLRAGGSIFFEINQEQGDQIKKLLAEMSFDEIELRDDLFGVPRMIRARKF